MKNQRKLLHLSELIQHLFLNNNNRNPWFDASKVFFLAAFLGGGALSKNDTIETR